MAGAVNHGSLQNVRSAFNALQKESGDFRRPIAPLWPWPSYLKGYIRYGQT